LRQTKSINKSILDMIATKVRYILLFYMFHEIKIDKETVFSNTLSQLFLELFNAFRE
jgi:hypothetical protein